MKVQLGAIYKTKDQWDSEYLLCPIENYSRNKYLNKRLLIRTTFFSFFAFIFGYSLYWFSDSISGMIDYILAFVYTYILSFYLMQPIHEFTHLVFYPKTFTDKNITIRFFNNKRLVTCISHSPISSLRLCFILMLPFILFTLLPGIYMLNINFNIYIYAFIVANAILSSDDIFNTLLQFFVKSENDEKYLYELPNVSLNESQENLVETKSDAETDIKSN